MPADTFSSDSEIETVQSGTHSSARRPPLPTSSANSPLFRPASSAERPRTTAGAWAPARHSSRPSGGAGARGERGGNDSQSSRNGPAPRMGGSSAPARNGGAGVNDVRNGRGKAVEMLELESTDDETNDRLPSPKSAFKPPKRPPAVARKSAPRHSLPHAAVAPSRRPRPAPRKSEPAPHFGRAGAGLRDDDDDDDPLTFGATTARNFAPVREVPAGKSVTPHNDRPLLSHAAHGTANDARSAANKVHLAAQKTQAQVPPRPGSSVRPASAAGMSGLVPAPAQQKVPSSQTKRPSLLQSRPSSSQVQASSSSQPRASTSTRPESAAPTTQRGVSTPASHSRPSPSTQSRPSDSQAHPRPATPATKPTASTSSAPPAASTSTSVPRPGTKSRVPKALLAAQVSAGQAGAPPLSSNAARPAPSSTAPASTTARPAPPAVPATPPIAGAHSARRVTACGAPPATALPSPPAARAARVGTTSDDSDLEIVSVGGVLVAPALRRASHAEVLPARLGGVAGAEERNVFESMPKATALVGSSPQRVAEAVGNAGTPKEPIRATGVHEQPAREQSPREEPPREEDSDAVVELDVNAAEEAGREAVNVSSAEPSGEDERVGRTLGIEPLPASTLTVQRASASASQRQPNGFAASNAPEDAVTPHLLPIETSASSRSQSPSAQAVTATVARGDLNGVAGSRTPEPAEAQPIAGSSSPPVVETPGTHLLPDKVATPLRSRSDPAAVSGGGDEEEGKDEGEGEDEDEDMQEERDLDEADEADSDGVSPRRRALGQRVLPIVSDTDDDSDEDLVPQYLPSAVSASNARTARKSTGGRPLHTQTIQPALAPADALQTIPPVFRSAPTTLRGQARKSTGGWPLTRPSASTIPSSGTASSTAPPGTASSNVPPVAVNTPPSVPQPAPLDARPDLLDGQFHKGARKATGGLRGRPQTPLGAINPQEVDGASALDKRKLPSPDAASASDADAPKRKRLKRVGERSKENVVIPRGKKVPSQGQRVDLDEGDADSSRLMAEDRSPTVPEVGEDIVDKLDDPGKRAELEAKMEAFKRRQQLERPWLRQIAGPSYDIDDEFNIEIQDGVNRREKLWAAQHPEEHPMRDNYKTLFEQMILEANAQEYPPTAPDFRPKIRVLPPIGQAPEAWSSPPFEFIYTNRVVYSDGIVPSQAPGCACKGDCGSPANVEKCTCRKRQIKASHTQPGGGKRSDHDGFAYKADMTLHDAVMAREDQIIECNSQCGCGPKCINRVVGARQGISVDIYFTGKNGWGVRLPESYWNDPINGTYVGRLVKRGEPLAIYSGELLRSQDAYERDTLVYNYIRRTYLYDLDLWSIGEDVRALAPQKLSGSVRGTDHHSARKPVQSPSGTGKKMKKPEPPQVDKKNTPPASGEDDDDDGFSSLYTVDAFTMGNWTRFANHVCSGFNAAPRPVYVDEGDVSRPLWVYFALRDIHPGDEITITYFGEEEPDPQSKGSSEQDWIRAANKSRQNAPPNHRCYCGKKLCRGRMFNVPDAMFWEKPPREGGG